VVVSCLAKTISSTPELGAASAQVYSGVVAGLVIISLTTVFHPVSGAHINPAISLAMLLIRRVSPIRAIGHVLAQCGGAIAGASVVLGLYGATEHFPTITVTNFGLEFLLTFMIVLVYLRVTDASDSKPRVEPGIPIGLSYMAALTAYKGAINPALALGQAFAVSKFTHHWVFWVGPVFGGSCAALCHEYIFNEQKDIQLALTNVKSAKEDVSDPIEDNNDNPVSKFGNKISYKEQEEQAPATPPLPWNVRRPIRSYSSEMINYPRHHHQDGGAEWENYEHGQCPPLERYSGTSSGYHSGPQTKQHKGHKSSSTHRKGPDEQNYHSLNRSHTHRHSNNTGKSSSSTKQNANHKASQGFPSGSKTTKPVKKNGPDSHFYVDY